MKIIGQPVKIGEKEGVVTTACRTEGEWKFIILYHSDKTNDTVKIDVVKKGLVAAGATEADTEAKLVRLASISIATPQRSRKPRSSFTTTASQGLSQASSLDELFGAAA